jgi:hypothetical protein
MKLRHFVSGSSAILAGWLAVTFVYHVPAQRYLKPEKFPTTSLLRHKTVADAAASGTKSAVFPFSVSR